VLSADIHRDESQSHCHVLVLPILNGKLNGAKMFGYKRRLHELQSDFLYAVASRYGLKMPPRRLSGYSKRATAGAVLRAIDHANDPALKSIVWGAIRQSIEADPMKFAFVFGIDAHEQTKRPRTMTQIFTSMGKGAKFEREATQQLGSERDQNLCSVDFQNQNNPTASTSMCSDRTSKTGEEETFDPETGEYFGSSNPNLQGDT